MTSNTDNVISLDVVDQVAREIEAHGLTQAAVARESGVDKSRLNQWLKRRYTGDNDAIDDAMRNWLASRKQRKSAASKLPTPPAWVRTPTATRIWNALSYAQMANDISVIYGAAGASKTETARAYQAQSPNVWIATMTPATATVVPSLEEIADTLGLEVSAAGGAAKAQRAIIRRLRDSFGLLIIDEAQNLNEQSLDAVRALHDATGVGLALIGNEKVYARLTGGHRAAYLDRLHSRIGKRVRIQCPGVRDVDPILDAWEVKGRAERQLLKDIATAVGGLRRMTKVLRMASMFAAGTGKPLSTEHIREAVRDLEDAGGQP